MGKLNGPRILFVADFDGALIRTNTDTLIFQKLKPKMDCVVDSLKRAREENIRMVEKDGLIPVVKESGGTIWKSHSLLRGDGYHVSWDYDAPKIDLSPEDLRTVICRRVSHYYGRRNPVPAREFFSALMPSDEQIHEIGEMKDAWTAYEELFHRYREEKITQLAFHEFIDAVISKRFKYSDIEKASHDIAENDIRDGVKDLFEILCGNGAHIAICSYSYINTVQIVLKKLISQHKRYQKSPSRNDPIGSIVANKIYCNDLNAQNITGIMHVVNKWETLDSKLTDVAVIEKDTSGRYCYSIGYEDDLNSLKEMQPRFNTSILLIKDKNRELTAEGIKAASGLTFNGDIKLEVCYESFTGGIGRVAEVVEKTINEMEKKARLP